MSKRVTITLEKKIEEWLLPEAASTGKSLSEVIRICLNEYREQNPNRFSMSDKARSESERPWLKPQNKE
jgi:hypothetical protein